MIGTVPSQRTHITPPTVAAAVGELLGTAQDMLLEPATPERDAQIGDILTEVDTIVTGALLAGAR